MSMSEDQVKKLLLSVAWSRAELSRARDATASSSRARPGCSATTSESTFCRRSDDIFHGRQDDLRTARGWPEQRLCGQHRWQAGVRSAPRFPAIARRQDRGPDAEDAGEGDPRVRGRPDDGGDCGVARARDTPSAPPAPAGRAAVHAPDGPGQQRSPSIRRDRQTEDGIAGERGARAAPGPVAARVACVNRAIFGAGEQGGAHRARREGHDRVAAQPAARASSGRRRRWSARRHQWYRRTPRRPVGAPRPVH
jgi:hypothetical protein